MNLHTEDLPFAAFLHATRLLRFLGCESVNGSGRINFVFDDPKDDGDLLQIDFNQALSALRRSSMTP